MTKTIRNLFFLLLIPIALLVLYLLKMYSPFQDNGVNPMETNPPVEFIEPTEGEGLEGLPDAESDPE